MTSSAIEQQILIGTYISVASGVLYWFETCITLSQEVDVIWSRRWTTTTWIYTLTHYTTFVLQIFAVMPDTSYESCVVGNFMSDALVLVQFLCFASFSTLRVFALLNGSFFIAGLVFALNLVPFATNLLNAVTVTPLWSPEVQACQGITSLSAGMLLRLSLISRAAAIISDALVLIVTWYKTAQQYREARRLKLSAPLTSLLFRDGTCYFLLLLTLNILQPILEDNPALSNLNLTTPFLQTVVPITIRRFILNLRQVDYRNAGNSQPSLESVRFVGAIGESLQFGADVDEDEESRSSQAYESQKLTIDGVIVEVDGGV